MTSAWQRAWLALGVTLGLHVIDEAVHGFLDWYNPIAARIQLWLGGFPFPPKFQFDTWLSGLIVLVVFCLAATPLFQVRRRWLFPIAMFWGLIHTGNGLLHLAASASAGRILPGTWTAPLLLIAAPTLLVTTWRVWRRGDRSRSGRPGRGTPSSQQRAGSDRGV